VKFLKNSVTEIEGYPFVGRMLWIDFTLRRNAERAMSKAEALMIDFLIILLLIQSRLCDPCLPYET